MPKKESLYHKHPDYRVDLERNDAHVCLRLDDEVIADSTSTLLVRETKLDPVIYFPKADVRFDHLEKTAHETFCPFKGEASYWTVRVADRVEENAVWGYEDPFEEVAGLKDYVSFYQDRFVLSSDGE
ncbi:MAG: DUF427 domain-containing protein [Deltaproteobacteria bacterium]|nr:DUF427 domain-containing protein [Deltaproteobacteria bacterium]